MDQLIYLADQRDAKGNFMPAEFRMECACHWQKLGLDKGSFIADEYTAAESDDSGPSGVGLWIYSPAGAFPDSGKHAVRPIFRARGGGVAIIRSRPSVRVSCSRIEPQAPRTTPGNAGTRCLAIG